MTDEKPKFLNVEVNPVYVAGLVLSFVLWTNRQNTEVQVLKSQVSHLEYRLSVIESSVRKP